MDKKLVKEYIEMLKNDFSQYIPDDRSSLGDISPSTMYWDILCRIETEIEK